MAVISSLPSNCLLRLSSSKANRLAQHHYSTIQSLSTASLSRNYLSISLAASVEDHRHHTPAPHFNCRNKLVALVAATAAGICLLSYIQTSAAAAPARHHQFPTHPADVIVDVLYEQSEVSLNRFWVPAASTGKDVSVRVRGLEAGVCPAWQPNQLEMVVPDEARPRSFSRQGRQWFALYLSDQSPNVQMSDIFSTSNLPKPDAKHASFQSKLTIAHPEGRLRFRSAATIQDLLAILSRQIGFMSCFNL